jgi:AAA domain
VSDRKGAKVHNPVTGVLADPRFASGIQVENLEPASRRANGHDGLSVDGTLDTFEELHKHVAEFKAKNRGREPNAKELRKLYDDAAAIIETRTAKAGPLLLSSADFVRGFKAPDYCIDGLVMRGFLYGMTGNTGAGKSAVGLYMAACKPLGRPLTWLAPKTRYEMDPGRVIYVAGENPLDIRMRWIAMGQELDFDVTTIPVHFIEGVVKLSDMRDRIRHDIQQIGDEGVSMIIVDTNSAYFEGDDENNTVQARNHALMLRSFTTMPGQPTVLSMCHPVKKADEDNLLPRGGGSFLCELDGNLVARRTAYGRCEVHWQGKFRVPEFAPISFITKEVTHPNLKDTKGRLVKTVVAQHLSDQAQEDMDRAARSEEDNLLVALVEHPKRSQASQTELATYLGWTLGDGTPHKVKVGRTLKTLESAKLVTIDRGNATLTSKGGKKVEKITGRKIDDDGED